MKRAVIQCSYCHAISVVYMTEIDFDYNKEEEQLITHMNCPVCEQHVLIRLVTSVPEQSPSIAYS